MAGLGVLSFTAEGVKRCCIFFVLNMPPAKDT